MGQFLHDTKTNLWMGLRLALFLPCESSQFAINFDQLVVLLLIDLSSVMIYGFLLALPEPVFYINALPNYCLSQVGFFLLLYLVTKIWKRPSVFLTTAVMVLTVSPFLNGLIYWDYFLREDAGSPGSHYHWWAVLISFFSLVILGRGLYLGTSRLKTATAFTLLSLIAIGVIQFQSFGESQKFWYPAEQEEDEEEIDKWADYRKMDAEQLMYRQPEILSANLKPLKPQRAHLSELFFVGFAPYATEDVFSKEVVFAKNLLDKRFDTQGHSINLINHLTTRDSIPLANGTNLAVTLKHIGKLMDKDEDVLMLYLTSHGSQDHKLAVDFYPLALNDLTPEKLRIMLDDSGIKWRVIIVSACYSGGFIKALEGDNSVIATAAAADRTSFGCGTESEFTYFGEAVFKDLLPEQFSIVSALQDASAVIDKREKKDSLKPSLPQLSVGKAIQAKLTTLGEELKQRQCGVDMGHNAC
jgi:hypothetical protein